MGSGKTQKQVVVVGGGFGGVSAALALCREQLPHISVTLVSAASHFEYKPALYRVVTGNSPLEVCVPLREIFKKKHVDIIVDSVTDVHCREKKIHTAQGGNMQFDYLVLGLGSETAFFSIPGLDQYSFGFKTIAEAIQLKQHIHHLFTDCAAGSADADEKVCLLHFVIVGAGPSGVELAGELVAFTGKLADVHHIDPSLITIDLIEAAPRILPVLSEAVSKRVAERLRALGVNVFTNRPMTMEEAEQITVRGMTMKTETVIWTAGVRPNTLYKNIQGVELAKNGRVVVDAYLQAKGCKDVFIIGDGAATAHAGMAQTAIADGRFVAKHIGRKERNKHVIVYEPKNVYYSLPVGPRWAASLAGSVTFYGIFGWLIRKTADLRYFLSILPARKAIQAFRVGKKLCEECGICSVAEKTAVSQ